MSSIDKVTEFLGLGLTTFVAAWAGGWAAFGAERNTRAQELRRARITAANRAIFKIAQLYNIYENLRKFYVDKDGARNDPLRAIKMDSPQPGMMKEVTFNFDDLSHFLDHPGSVASQTLMELQVFDWHYQVVRNTVELRVQALSELRQAMRERRMANLTFESLQTFYADEFRKAASLADQMIEVVDAGIRSASDIYRKMQEALQLQFPGESFLKVNFTHEAAAADAKQ